MANMSPTSQASTVMAEAISGVNKLGILGISSAVITSTPEWT